MLMTLVLTNASFSEALVHIVHTTTALNTGWIDIDFDEPIIINSSQDLWVFVYDPVGREYPACYSNFSEHTNGGYCSSSYPIATVSGYLPSTFGNAAWLIKTYVTDGTYTYNLYDGTTQVTSNINATNYTVSNAAGNPAHRYTLKTNYYGGETNASNMVGFTIGNASLSTLALNANDKMTITFTVKEINDKIVEMLRPKGMQAPVELVFQSIEGLHHACPNHPGDWYFTGFYPTPGGTRLVNQAFVNYMDSL